jgi:hypothetical protein
MKNTPPTPLKRGAPKKKLYFNARVHISSLLEEDYEGVMFYFITEYEKHTPNPSQEGNS